MLANETKLDTTTPDSENITVGSTCSMFHTSYLAIVETENRYPSHAWQKHKMSSLSIVTTLRNMPFTKHPAPSIDRCTPSTAAVPSHCQNWRMMPMPESTLDTSISFNTSHIVFWWRMSDSGSTFSDAQRLRGPRSIWRLPMDRHFGRLSRVPSFTMLLQ